MPHLHIRASGKANDERTNDIFASSFALPFVTFALEAVFRTRVKRDEWRFALCVRTYVRTQVKTVLSHRDRGIRMFVQVARRSTSTYV